MELFPNFSSSHPASNFWFQPVLCISCNPTYPIPRCGRLLRTREHAWTLSPHISIQSREQQSGRGKPQPASLLSNFPFSKEIETYSKGVSRGQRRCGMGNGNCADFTSEFSKLTTQPHSIKRLTEHLASQLRPQL